MLESPRDLKQTNKNTHIKLSWAQLQNCEVRTAPQVLLICHQMWKQLATKATPPVTYQNVLDGWLVWLQLLSIYYFQC